MRYLVLVGAIGILPRLFDVAFVPDEVLAELRHAKAPAAVRRWANALPPWLNVRPAPSSGLPELGRLDAGERAAIALAIALRPDFILIDERAGVAAARANALEVVGTLGLLDRAAQAGLVDLPAVIAALRTTNFRAHESLFDALLARERKRRAT